MVPESCKVLSGWEQDSLTLYAPLNTFHIQKSVISKIVVRFKIYLPNLDLIFFALRLPKDGY